MDVSGRLVSKLSYVSKVIDVSDFEQGIYYMNIKNKFGNSIYFNKVIVL